MGTSSDSNGTEVTFSVESLIFEVSTGFEASEDDDVTVCSFVSEDKGFVDVVVVVVAAEAAGV